jgi:hypothetical protein
MAWLMIRFGVSRCGGRRVHTYEVEFDLADGQVLATVRPEDFGVA